MGPFLEKAIEDCESAVIHNLINCLTPGYRKWFAKWKESWKQKQGTFSNPWPYIIETSVEVIKKYCSDKIVNQYRKYLRENLKDHMNINSHQWSSADKWNWSLIMQSIIRRALIDIVPLSALADITLTFHSQFTDIIDSQVLALVDEKIFDESAEIQTFIEKTYFACSTISSQEMKSAYATGLRERYLYVAGRVQDVKVRSIFNKTGFSIDGNEFLYKNLKTIRASLEEWRTGKREWRLLLEDIIGIIDKVPDLKPGWGQKRSTSCILDWVDGFSIMEITEKHFDQKVEKAVKTIESSITSLIPWGVNSLFTLLTDLEGEVLIEPELINLPAMISFGVPTYLAAYALSQKKSGIRKILYQSQYELPARPKSQVVMSFCYFRMKSQVMKRILTYSIYFLVISPV